MKKNILLLPLEISQQLPSRGQVMVEAELNRATFRTPLEPDGSGSHWCIVPHHIMHTEKLNVGDVVTVKLQTTHEWVEPDVPEDLQRMLMSDPKLMGIWRDITPMARWEWVRWTRSTPNADTRAKRIEVARSKMLAGKRRPCCWNRNLCTEPSVSKNGVLQVR